MRKQVQLRSIFFLFFLFTIVLACTMTMVESKSGTISSKIKGSPPVTKHTKAILTINDFQKGGSGGGPSECDNKFHSNETPVVALSTGWFNRMKRCHKFITIHGNGKSVRAMVVDECDSTKGCDTDIVDASAAVWEALKVPKKDWGQMQVFWSDD